ncbi:UTRA domain-containing protein [Rhizobium leguminosarum]|uniref:UTRA domain-containing protein n=1 Tax=Rhizobium leguminosarum TaxID=384 RepID=UPI001C959872|nr:UTRA domain-containing protein [Rhizobium leguminosarum]
MRPIRRRTSPFLADWLRCGGAFKWVASIINGTVISVSSSYFPRARFPDADAIYRRTKSTIETYRSYGIEDFLRDRTWIGSRMPHGDEARLLSQPKSRPIMVTRKVDTSMDGQPLTYSETLWSSDRVEFVLEGKDIRE